MEKEILTLENFDEKVLELLKKENYGSNVITIEWDDGVKFDKKDLDEIFDIKEKNDYDNWKDVIPMYINNNWNAYENILLQEENLIDKVVKEYVKYSSDSEEYEEIVNKIENIIQENFVYDYDIETLIENTKINNLSVFLISNSEKRYLEDECLGINIFNDYDELVENLERDKFNPITFLIQSQGYELEDLYNKEKVENSKFLKSLKNEFDQNSGFYNNLAFIKVEPSLEEAIYFYNFKDNLTIPKEGIYCGFVDVFEANGSVLEIELEKDIILNKNNFKIFTDFGDKEGSYSVSELYNLDKKTPETFFKETKEKGFEQHEINIDNVLENAKKHFEIENELDNNKVIVIK